MSLQRIAIAQTQVAIAIAIMPSLEPDLALSFEQSGKHSSRSAGGNFANAFSARIAASGSVTRVRWGRQ